MAKVLELVSLPSMALQSVSMDSCLMEGYPSSKEL